MSQPLRRRDFLRLAALGGVGVALAACSAPAAESPPAPTALPAPTSPPAAPTAAPTSPLVTPAPTAVGGATSVPAAPTAAPPTVAPTAAPALAGTMAQAAAGFLAALSPEQRARAGYAFDDPERQRWHWTTPQGFPRNGLPLRDMDEAQAGLAMALLQASLSEAGYRKAADIMALQRELGNDASLYFVTVFGEPGAEPWGWRFEGHHLSRNFAVRGGQVAATPFFHGAWPNTTDAGLRAMPREEDAARELVGSLSGPAREAAIFQGRSLGNHVTGNQPYVAPLDQVGVAAGELDDAQRALVMEIVETYLGSQEASVAGPSLARVRDTGVENIRFAWAGDESPRRPHYYRLQGPTFLLEFDNSRNSGTHIHSVWRDFDGDFGQNLA